MGSGYRTFTAGEVLTASNVQNYLQDQAVMVFGGSAARSSAIGTANFEEGMTSYLTDTDKLEVYNGTNWVSVAPTSTQGLTLINTTSFSGVASISLPASTFTSTYTNYRIMFQNISPANSLALSMRLRTSGTDNSTSNYDSAFLYAQSTSAYASASDNASSFALTASSGARIISTIDLMNPQTADDTLMVHSTYQTTSDSGTYNVGGGRFQLGTSFDSATFIANSTNLLTGQVQVYGYSK